MRASFNLFALVALFVAILSVVSTSALTVPRSANETAAPAEVRSNLEPVEQELESRTTHSGHATYFYPGKGACGWNSGSNDYIFAISAHAWNGGNKCGKSARICHGSKCVTAKLVDECPGCSSGSLDLSPAAFKKLASLSTGEVSVKWHFT